MGGLTLRIARSKVGPERVVVLREVGDVTCVYTYEDDGHSASSQTASVRQPSKFRLIGADEAKPFAGPPPEVLAPEILEGELEDPAPKVEPDPAPRVEESSTAIVTFQVEGWTLGRSGPGEALIEDIELGRRLALSRPRDIRKTIFRVFGEPDEKTGEIRPNVFRSETRHSYWLTRAQALKVSARSETPPADALLDEMIHVFELALDGKLPGQVNATEASIARLTDLVIALEEGQHRRLCAVEKLIASLQPAPAPTAPPPLPPKPAPLFEGWKGHTVIARDLAAALHMRITPDHVRDFACMQPPRDVSRGTSHVRRYDRREPKRNDNAEASTARPALHHLHGPACLRRSRCTPSWHECPRGRPSERVAALDRPEARRALPRPMLLPPNPAERRAG